MRGVYIMKHPSEIFDQLQYLYQVTKFNDHQVHCVIEFENSINANILEKAVNQLIRTYPILSRVYHNHGGKSYWADAKRAGWKELFIVVHKKEDFDRFTLGKILEDKGPQIKVCLLKAQKDALSIIFNHMVTDGAGVKQCIYCLASIYSKLVMNPNYVSENLLDGNRSYRKILEGISFKEKCKILFLHNKENNQNSRITFPMSNEDNISPFLLVHHLPKERFHKLQEYGKASHTTVNDVLLTAYFRSLAKMLDLYGKSISIPIMIDMRRYLKNKRQESLTNLSSTAIIKIIVEKGESFCDTLTKVNSEMQSKKDNYLGLNTFIKLNILYKLFGRKLSFQILKIALKNPPICMTNIGIIDSKQLSFEGSSIANSFMFGSIKYRPHFQIAVSSYDDTLTLTVNLYGSRQDQANMNKFLNIMDKELKNTENYLR